VPILAKCLPVGKRPAVKLDQRPTGAVIQVRVEVIVMVSPSAIEQPALRPINDVALEGEAAVRLILRATNLCLLAQGKDVVLNAIVPAIVLVKAAVFGPIDNVVFNQDIARAFVRIDAPAAVSVTGNVVADVIALNGARLHAERVDAGEIAQHAATDIVDAVKSDHVAARCRRTVTPGPAHGNSRIVGVVDFIV